jgi:predicted dehydrogenase
MSRLRTGVVGGGLIAQVAHLPNLAALGDAFELVAIADVSGELAAGLAQRHPPARPYADWAEMLAAERLDAVVVCAPHATHAEVTLAALDRGLHVLVEKPLCIAPDDADAICARRRETGLVVQVGYMKRFHAGYEAFLDALPAGADELRLIDVVTYDPWLAREPFVPWSRMLRAGPVAPAVAQRGERSEREQVHRAVGRSDRVTVRAFGYAYLAGLVHDVNLVHGALDRMGMVGRLEPRAAAERADGKAASFSVLLPGGATWHCAWLLLDGLLDFRETARLYFRDAIHELSLPAPYNPTARVEHRVTAVEHDEHSVSARALVDDAYRAELVHFHDCVAHGTPCRTPPEQAKRDVELLRDVFVAGAQER